MEIRFAQHNNIFDGRYEITGSLENHHTTSLIECNMKCSFNKECLTFYYNSLIQQCILHRDSYTLPSRMGTGWKLYYTNDGSGRCPSTDGFMYYKRLDLCFNLNSPMTINFPVIKSFCSQMNAELIRIDSSDKQQFIEFITVYLDDIIVFSKTFDEHLKNLSEVCDRLRSANLKLHPKKCFLLQKEVTFLGHKVSHEGKSTDDEKIKAVQDWPTPKNVKDVRSFIGLCSYYRRFVENFSTIAKPLHQLTEKCKKFEWTEACNCSFEHLKKLLISAPILGYPINDGGFILDTDASNVGMGENEGLAILVKLF
ncbi:Retrovirus-related Pol polyprotein from transposon 17.6,Retrovirus-related Pol polyprotein from transposon 412,Retrovirus-related Pol polyprotein from transposon 297 [Mytilus edulis]|uniref:Retrovirus-related Pol polyprotein from transposon 17.6,Retrovirus-related Pol polyprotein from transposon 412,Retrovirus-related Pol polyprotein from transposon 297 n=1 Tax=Mytilus edulis TaxID=6550 RepID=A0A8S3TGD4_MYTED|nr:Retrovirus-related Pol polyprotein from transposon 17.6,Retrovirus-related Pol polyprotein from transposon 412,Retrovirus-related Pol polyprotein from transposon 297 [Mytilus edulis]